MATVETAEGLYGYAEYGILGILVAGLLVFAKAAYSREASRADRMEQRLLELHKSIHETYVPALQDAATAQKAVVILLQDLYSKGSNT